MKKFLKIFATVIVFTIIGLFILRCCMVTDRSFGKRPAVTDALKSAFADGESVIYVHDQTAEISSDGYFSAFNMFYNPESGESQLSVRWNNSAYSYTDTEPGTEFSFRLVNETTGEEYPCTAIESKKLAFYNYRRLTAENTKIESSDQVYVIMEVNGEYESKQVVKYDGQGFKEYKIPSRILKNLVN